MAFLEIENISKSFAAASSPRHVLDRVNLRVEEGEFVSVVGFTGSGKSTFLKILAGILSPDKGQVRIEGEPVNGVRDRTAFVFQNYSLLPWRSALGNVRLAVEAAFPDWTRTRHEEQAKRYLEMVGLSNALQKRPGQLSGGMRQRVAIARAFAVEPSVLFLDEPFGALDALTRSTLQQELAKMCSVAARPVTTVMITNNVEEALLLSDRIVPMTRAPKATLGVPVEVTLPKPRTAAMLMHNEKAVRLQAQIVAFLAEFAHNAAKPVSGAQVPKSVLNRLVVAEEKYDCNA